MPEHALIVHLPFRDGDFGSTEEQEAASGGFAIKRYGEAQDASAPEVRVPLD